MFMYVTRDVDYTGFLLMRCFHLPVGQLRVVLANKITIRFETQKTKPSPKQIGRYGHFGPIWGPVFLS